MKSLHQVLPIEDILLLQVLPRNKIGTIMLKEKKQHARELTTNRSAPPKNQLPEHKNCPYKIQVRDHPIHFSSLSLLFSLSPPAMPLMAFSLRFPHSLPHSRLSPFSCSPHLFSLPTHSVSSKPYLYSSNIQCTAANDSGRNKTASSLTQSFDPKRGVSVYRPKSYEVLVTDAAKSVAYALEDGKTRLEIEFP